MPGSSHDHTHRWRPVRWDGCEWCWVCTRYRRMEEDGWRIYDTLPKLKRALAKEGIK